MTESDLRARLRRCMTEAFEIEADDLPEGADTESVMQWDSLGHMTLIEVIETEFGIALEHADSVSMLSEGEILDVLRQKLPA